MSNSTNNNNNNNNANKGENNMSIKEILIAVHNQAMDDMATIHNNNPSITYMEAVMDCYEEVLRQLNVEETDEILEEILNMNPNSMTSDNNNMDKVIKTITVNGLVGVGAINLGLRMLLSPTVLQALAVVPASTKVGLLAVPIATTLPMVLVILWIAHSLFPQSMNGQWGNKNSSAPSLREEGNDDDDNTNINKGEISMNNVKVTTSKSALSDIPNMDDSDLTPEEIAIANEADSMGEQLASVPSMADKTDFIVLTFPGYSNPDAITELKVEFKIEKGVGSMRWVDSDRKWYRITKNLIKVQKSFNFTVEDDYIFTAPSVKEVIADIKASVIAKCKKKANIDTARNFLNGMVGTVLTSEWESSDENVNAYNQASIQANHANLVDAQRVLRDNEVVAYHVNANGTMLLNTDRSAKSAWVDGCLEAATEAFGFTLPDKTNTKRAFIGDALGIMGMSADGRISMVEADKAGKFFNRHAMVKHISAELENAAPDSLLAELSNNKFAASWGARLNSLFVNSPLVSLAVGDGGFVVRNPLTYTACKRIDGSLNIDALFAANPEYKASVVKAVGSNRKAQLKHIKSEVEQHIKDTYVEGQGGISVNGTVEFQGQVVATNRSNFPVLVMNDAQVSAGKAINTEIRTLNVRLKTKTTITDYNFKARGQWFKGMATRNDDVVVNDSEAGTSAPVEAEVIFNDNCVKNRKAMLIRMWANATGQQVAFCKDGEFRLVNYNEETGIFETVKGQEGLVDFDKVQADLESKYGKSVTVSLIVNTKDLADFKAADKKAVKADPKRERVFTADVREESLDNGLVRLEFKAQAIEAPLVYAVELSSVAENFSPNRNVAPNQADYLTTFSPISNQVDETIRKSASRISKTISNIAAPGVSIQFDLNLERSELAETLTKANKASSSTKEGAYNAKSLFKTLADKYPLGIQISGSDENGKRNWNVLIPTSAIHALGGFDKSGNSYDDKIHNTYAFLCLLADEGACLNLVADYAMKLGRALEEWCKDIVNNKKAFTKGSAVFNTHGMKVLSNSKAGYETYNGVEIPVIALDESNPLVTGKAIDKQGREAKKLKDGDIVFFYRNPMIDVTPAIIRITKNETVCGKFTCAVSPAVLAWSSQTDNDGDVLWIIPASQFRMANITGHQPKLNEQTDKVEEISNIDRILEASAHPLVGQQIAESTMAAFGCGDTLSGILKARDAFSVLRPAHKVDINVIDNAELVANHYRIRVGQGYGAMFNAYASYVRKHRAGGNFSTEELQGIKGCSFVLYEEWGLSGYSLENETNIKAIRDIAKGKLGTAKKVRSGNPFLNASNSKQSAKEYAAGFVAQHMVQSKVERNESVVTTTTEAHAIKKEALTNGLFRTLTKGAFSNGSKGINPLFAKATVDVNSPYAEALTTWQSFAEGGLTIGSTYSPENS